MPSIFTSGTDHRVGKRGCQTGSTTYNQTTSALLGTSVFSNPTLYDVIWGQPSGFGSSNNRVYYVVGASNRHTPVEAFNATYGSGVGPVKSFAFLAQSSLSGSLTAVNLAVFNSGVGGLNAKYRDYQLTFGAKPRFDINGKHINTVGTGWYNYTKTSGQPSGTITDAAAMYGRTFISDFVWRIGVSSLVQTRPLPTQ